MYCNDEMLTWEHAYLYCQRTGWRKIESLNDIVYFGKRELDGQMKFVPLSTNINKVISNKTFNILITTYLGTTPENFKRVALGR